MTECTGCPDCNALSLDHLIASMPLTLNISSSGGVDVQSVDDVYLFFFCFYRGERDHTNISMKPIPSRQSGLPGIGDSLAGG